ncbi:MAG: hypothetical protein F9K21_12105 [Rhodocyclaceae bacterium]|nr:MAG: hypothetical protein F9K21_12105 [Rhodocyclaceae bacterium]
MDNHIHQLNVTYVTAEDRILLRLNTTNKEEFRIWLTRRVVRKLARELGGAERRLLGLENPEAGYVAPGARAIQAFRREASTVEVDFGERFEEGSAGFPFGDAPVLATGCEVQLQKGKATIALALANKRILSFVLDVRGIHGTLAMLQKAVAHSDWDLGQELDNETRPPVGQAGLH